MEASKVFGVKYTLLSVTFSVLYALFKIHFLLHYLMTRIDIHSIFGLPPFFVES